MSTSSMSRNLCHHVTTSLATFSLVGLTLAGVAHAMNQQPRLPAEIDADQWASIKELHSLDGYSAKRSVLGFEAANPAQQWTATFDSSGFLVQSSRYDWSWGLELRAYGFEGGMRSVAESAALCAEGSQVTNEWNLQIQEWYVNDPKGLEHGFTIQDRPTKFSEPNGPLVLGLLVRGDLTAIKGSTPNALRFVDSFGETQVNYGGLTVFDANGKTVPALLECEEEHVRIVIYEQTAAYPLTVDPIAQLAMLRASNHDLLDQFGFSLALSNNLLVVGAPHERSDAQGVNGDQTNNDLFGSGAAYVFERVGETWTQQAYLKASNRAGGFGWSVDIAGEVIVVGSPKEANAESGVNGNQNHNYEAQSAGAAYVFERIAGVWTQTAYMKASNADEYDEFGCAVAMGNDVIAVGARYESSDSIGIGGDQTNAGSPNSGAVYVFERAGNTWAQQAYVKASNSDRDFEFGSSLAMSGNRLVVGAPGESHGSTGVNGDQNAPEISESGAVYILENTPNGWVQQDYLKASNTGDSDHFGYAVDIDGPLIVVGAPSEDSSGTGVNPDQSAYSLTNIGAGYVFALHSGMWSQEAFLKATRAVNWSEFGTSVTASGERVIVTAPRESSRASGVDGNPDLGGSGTGAAYLFQREQGNWSHIAYVKALDPGWLDYYGSSLAMEGTVVFVGARGRRGGASGSEQSAGATYLLDLDAPVGGLCSPAVANSSGVPGVILMAGSRVVSDNNFTLFATQLPVNKFGYFFSSQGHGEPFTPISSVGEVCLGGGSPVGRHHRGHEVNYSDIHGTLLLALDLTDMPTPTGYRSVVAGEVWKFQCWFREGLYASNFTNALSVRFE